MEHTVLTFLSLASFTTAVIGFFPPWQIGRWPSCNGLYLVLAVSVYLATVRDRNKLRRLSQRIFPALILTAIVLSSYSVGIGAGIISGIVIALGLGLHILLLISKTRTELWNTRPTTEPSPDP